MSTPTRKPLRVTTIQIIDFDDGKMGLDFKYDPSLDIAKIKQDEKEGRPGPSATMGEMYATSIVKMMTLEENVVTINMPSGVEVPVVRTEGHVICADPDVDPEKIERLKKEEQLRMLGMVDAPTDKRKLN